VKRLTAQLYPIKNMIPDFYDAGWFNDPTISAPAVEVINPYKMIMTNTFSAQGRLIWIPVEAGKTYTFSFGRITGLYRFYKRKVNNHDTNMVLVQDSVPQDFTFTADESYAGFVTLRLTYGGAGVLVFEDMQLEEGTVKTPFKPLELGNKPAELTNNLLTPEGATPNAFINETTGNTSPSGAGTSSTDFLPVTEQKTYVFENFPATFPLVQRFAWYDKNKNFIGGFTHYSAVNASKEATAPWGAKYIRFSVVPVDYAIARMYEKGTAPKNKPAQLVPTKNLLDTNDGDWTNGSADGNWNFFVDSSRIRKNNRVPVEPSTLYTLKVDDNYQIYVRQFGLAGFEIGSSQWRDNGYSFTTENDVRQLGVILRRKDNGTITMSELPNIKPMIAQGIQTVTLPYELGNRPAQLFPQKNLIPPLSDLRWYLKTGQVKGEIVNDYEYKMTIDRVGVVGYDIPIQLEAGKTYTLGASLEGSGARMRLMRNDNEAFLVNINPSAPIQTYTATIADYRIRIENNGQMGEFTTKDFYLYEGNIPDPVFEPMKLDWRPAELFPQKNLLIPLPRFPYTNATGKVSFEGDYKLIMEADASGLYYNYHAPIERGVSYTASIQDITSNARVALREVKANGSKVFITNLTPESKTFSWTPASDTVKIEYDCTTNGLGHMEFNKPQLEIGNKATPFEPYKLGNR
jgi:hypothetical protein